MPLVVQNQGQGFVPSGHDIGDGWRVSLNGSPAILGQSAGRLGTLSFSGKCTNTTKFSIDNYVSVQHYYDGQIDRWLTTFDGYIRNIDTDNKFGSFTVNSIMSALDVDRTAHVNDSGVLQRSIRLPSQIPYLIGATTYYTGGFYSSVGSENIWNPRPIIIWDVTQDENYMYVLASGGHNGEVVFEIGVDGIFRNVWPVYSDATDLAGPDSRYMTQIQGALWIAQVNADRVKRFNTSGSFTLQWGAAGTLDGQFSTISGIAAHPTVNGVYVTDSVAGRVQVFNYTGTFLFKWGTLGTGVGNTVFNAPNGISVDWKSGNLFISDRNARVREYTSGGAYVSQPMGSYDFSASASTGVFVAGGYYIKTTFDSMGNAYACQLGKVFKYVRNGSTWALSASTPDRTWSTPGVTDLSPPSMLSASPASGILSVARSQNYVDQYSGSMGNLKAYILYYIALAAKDFPVRLMALNDTYANGTRAYIGWEGNVWNQLCELLAATDNAMAGFDDKLVFFNREDRYYRMPDDAVIEPIELDSRGAGLAVEIVNYNSRFTVGAEVMYNAQADNRRTFSMDTNSLSYVTVSQDSYPEYVIDPIPSTVITDGGYVVLDQNSLVVPPATWTNYGGSIRADLGERPGTILLTLTGPGIPIPGYEAPYKVADAGSSPALSVLGGGVKINPEVISIGTGLSEQVTNRLVAQTIDSPFSDSAATAYAEGSWAAYNSGTPHQKYSITFRVNRSPLWSSNVGGIGGTFQFMNSIIQYDDAQYIVEDMSFNASTITLSCYRYTKTAWGTGTTGMPPRHEEIWAGKTANEFDAYWQGYTAQDYTIAPLRNPYGV